MITQSHIIALGFEGIILAPGDTRTTCPHCSGQRYKTRDRCLSVYADDHTRVAWRCNHCRWEGEAPV